MKPVIAIRHQPEVPLGVAERALSDAGVDWRYLDAWEATEWPDLDEVSGLVVLGGKMSAYQTEEYPFLKREHSIVEEAIERDIPMIGICLGAQILARVLGAKVEPMSAKGLGFMRVDATPEGREDPVASSFAPDMRVLLFHEDAFDLPPNAEPLLTDASGKEQAFRFGRAYGMQFHFEPTESLIAGWCDMMPNFEEEWGVSKDDLLRQARECLPGQQAACKATFASFASMLETSDRI